MLITFGFKTGHLVNVKLVTVGRELGLQPIVLRHRFLAAFLVNNRITATNATQTGI
jgi:hypothetical protein